MSGNNTEIIQPAVNNGAGEVRITDAGLSSGAGTPIITIESLQRYVEAERSRNRHALLWTSTLFLFVVLLILVMFVSIGIHVLRRTRQTSQLVSGVRAATELQAEKLDGVADRVAQVAEIQNDVKRVVEGTEKNRAQQEKLVQSNLERFGQWVSSGNSREARAMVALEARLRQMEQAAIDREQEFLAFRKEYESRPAVAADTVEVVASAKSEVPQDAVPQEATVSSTQAVADVTGITEVDLADDVSSDEWMDTELASAEDLILGEIGAMEGRGPDGEISVVTFPNGDRYEGEFSDGLFNGWGVYYYHNGDRYEGGFRNDMKDGRGTYTSYNGDKYIGEFKHGMKHGRGSVMYMNGDRYVGEFLNDMQNGKGTIIYQNGNRYSGSFRNGLKGGNGVFRFDNGDVYKGEFKDDLRYGKGTYIYADGAKYIGEFSEGRRHGKGRYIYAGGEEYIGEFKDGRKEGSGACIYPNGMRIKGLWKNDKFLRRLN